MEVKLFYVVETWSLKEDSRKFVVFELCLCRIKMDNVRKEFGVISKITQ